ncbi:hypothetical protein M8Z33_42260 [Streptomyces sp. ZAF1911]|nr:hypothetical protein [Streptomyces sp. ZAF1911]MDD9383164.1 hypothetical protein [Streptomyces sp. ZAF1911]
MTAGVRSAPAMRAGRDAHARHAPRLLRRWPLFMGPDCPQTAAVVATHAM